MSGTNTFKAVTQRTLHHKEKYQAIQGVTCGYNKLHVLGDKK